jgi:choline dehydrogenase-like flavoprotein
MRELPRVSMAGAALHDGFDLDDPEEGGTVSLDRSGHARIRYKWTERLRGGLKAGTRNSMALMLAGGARYALSGHLHRVQRLEELDAVLESAPFDACKVPVFSGHVMGGCTMGRDPRRSVVDSETLGVHGLDNLFVVDGSVFPTSLTVNPQLTIFGLASWASERIASLAC